MAGDLNREASELWNSLKPIIDKEIDARTQGVVQRRKAKVTTAPSLVTNTIGVTEPFGTEMFLPFNTNIMSASVGDFVWVEYMYGMTNAFVSMFASADDKNQYVAGNLTVGGALSVTNRRSYLLSNVAAGWHRVLEFSPTTVSHRLGRAGIIVDFDITRYGTTNETHHVSLSLIETNAKFYGEFSNSNTQLIDKIRYTYDSSKGYVDIHLSTSWSANVAVDYQVSASAGSFLRQITTKSLAAVADSPSGETVLTEYALHANGTYNGNLTVDGVLDVTPRRVTASPASAGWYRVMKYTNTEDAYRRGCSGAEIVFHITRRRTTDGEETHEIKMLCNMDGIMFADEVSRVYSNSYFKVDGIRYTYDSTAAYVDVHVLGAAPVLTVSFDVYDDPSVQYRYTAEQLQGVGDNPDGETILRRYYFGSMGHRYAYSSLSTAGWYRIIRYHGTSATAVKWGTSCRIDIHLTQAYNNSNNCAHSITMLGLFNTPPVFTNEVSAIAASDNVFTKIRYTYNPTTYEGSIDVYYNASVANSVYVNFDVYATETQKMMFSSAYFEPVVASPDGETVWSEYTFSANGTGDLNVNGTVTGQGFADLLFGLGASIPSNTDCNSLTSEGKYTCASAAVAGTLTNSPYTDSAFGMLVIRVASSQRLVQVAMPNSTAISVKLRYYNGTSWTAWKTLTPS